ncbi:MAG: response regulator, partial [Muribaculaceae bacterium]|nr:response regulator [Muribaculaceae bacterium]
TEFSDGAAFITPDSLLIFGGIDGIAVIRHTPGFADGNLPANDRQPRLISLSVNGKDMPLHTLYSRPTNTITLNHDQNHINLAFSAPEFVTPGSTTMLYSLDGSVWMNNGNSYRLPLNSLTPGKHTLYVKSYNHDTQSDGNVTRLNITVTPPWYLSDAAIFIYVLLVIIAVALVGLYLLRRQRRAQMRAIEKMRQHHKEELYEEKLRFFTNITHEFCTPLTLIAGPCERILSYEHSDDYIRRYASLIFTNGQRLNNLIQEIIDLRRIETGHSPRKVRHIDVSELCNDTIATFDDMAERTSIKVVNEVTPGIVWNTDYNSISKIINNLISNAFKYTPTGGTIRVSLSTDADPDTLRLVVWNTGKGIRPEDKERIFNRYAILDNIEEKVTHGLSARNGLGMAICYSMVEQLEGHIEIESEVGSYASFIVTLPQLTVDATADDDNMVITKAATPALTAPAATPAAESGIGTGINTGGTSGGSSTRRLLIVDDNEEMLTLLSDSLSEYDVTTASDGSVAIDLLTKSVYDLIITDVMMPGTDGLELARQIKANRHTAHIPLIILSAKVSNDEIIQGIESGADVYIRKPFSFGYLRAMISRLIQRQDQLRDYYNTSGSAFMYDGGQLVSREDKEFIDKLTTYIDSNIEDSELSIDSVSRHLNMSTRNLYRKLKDLGMASPNDLIKEHRMASAARLLCTTSLTVQEIMFRTGFSNRSHFFREFAKRYNMTPKEYRMANCTRDDTLGRRGKTGSSSPDLPNDQN